MSTKYTTFPCFQCGKPRIVTGVTKNFENGSLVVSTESVCSDEMCQKRTASVLNAEIKRRVDAETNKRLYGRKPLKAPKVKTG